MSKVVIVEYDATRKVLRLTEPLEGVEDHARLLATLENAAAPDAWGTLRSTVSKEQLDELAAIVEEMFPIEN
jgi:hypothetical protein